MYYSSGQRMMRCLRILLLFLISDSLAANQDVDDVRYRCTRWHQSSMRRDDSVFIDGGVELLRNGGATWLGFSKYIFEIDMSRPWDTTTNFTEKRIGRFGNSLMGANPPNMVRGALFRGPPNDSKLYTFGGSTFLANDTDPSWQPPGSNQFSLWSYDTTSMMWGQYDVSRAVPRRPNWGSVTEAVSLGIGFVLNGQVDRGSSNVLYSTAEYVGGKISTAAHDQIDYVGGMLVIDLPTRIARNVSTDTLGPPRIAGGLVYAPDLGRTRKGYLVAFGGMKSSDAKNNTFQNGAMVEFNTVSLCDTWNEEKPTWIHQPTSGETPPPRMDFCMLPAPRTAKDNSSHNFYMYGGYDPTSSTMYDDVWILSLPSFTWIKAHSGNNPRFGHTCNAAGKRQMLAVGGSLNASMYGVETTGRIPSELNTMKCDPREGVALFDLTDLTWGTYFNPYSPAYQIPQKVVDVIGGSGEGGATMTQPASGFADPAISMIFNPPIIKATNSRSGNKKNVTNIIGGVIGVIVGCVLILLVTFFVLRRRPRAVGNDDNIIIEDQYPDSKELHGDSQVGSPQEMSGGFAHIKEMEAGSPAQELPAAMNMEGVAQEGVVYELESSEEPTTRSLSPSPVLVSPEDVRA